MIGFHALVAAMTLQSVEALSGDEAPTGVTPKQVSPEKPKKRTPKAKATPKGVPKPKVQKSTKQPVLKRPAAASSAATESQGPEKQSKKRPASSVSSPKALKVYKYYYKDLEKWGFKINGSEKFSVTRTHFSYTTILLLTFGFRKHYCDTIAGKPPAPEFKKVDGISKEKGDEIAVTR